MQSGTAPKTSRARRASSSAPRSIRIIRRSSRARELGIPLVTRGRMLAELTAGKKRSPSPGTHGKTTTTAMIAAVLEAGGLDPTVVDRRRTARLQYERARRCRRRGSSRRATSRTARSCIWIRRSRSSRTSRTITLQATSEFASAAQRLRAVRREEFPPTACLIAGIDDANSAALARLAGGAPRLDVRARRVPCRLWSRTIEQFEDFGTRSRIVLARKSAGRVAAAGSRVRSTCRTRWPPIGVGMYLGVDFQQICRSVRTHSRASAADSSFSCARRS